VVQKNELQNRIIFGVIAAAIAALAIAQGGYVFFAFVILLSFIISREFDNLRKDGQLAFLYCAIPLLLSYHPGAALVVVFVAVSMVMVAQYQSKKLYPWLTISILYVTVPAVSLIWLRMSDASWFLWLVLVIIATDIGAYFCGRAFGKHLLAPKISPKKTWEGLAGGAFVAAVVSTAYTENLAYAPYAILFAALGQASDLTESAIKRYFDVKDTGTILPGHGGIMDRTDGFVLTAPLFALMVHAGFLAW